MGEVIQTGVFPITETPETFEGQAFIEIGYHRVLHIEPLEGKRFKLWQTVEPQPDNAGGGNAG